MKMRDSNIRNYVNWIELMMRVWSLHNPSCVCKVCCELRVMLNNPEYRAGSNSAGEVFQKCLPQDKAKENYNYLVTFTRKAK